MLLFKILVVESHGVPTTLHKDGVSYGYFGLTKKACQEVDAQFPPATPKDEFVAAKAYLTLMKKRHNCDWLTAAGWYHGGDEERREAYIDKLMQVKPEDNWDALNVFENIINYDSLQEEE